MKRILTNTVLVFSLFLSHSSKAQSYDEKKLEVTLRQIGFDLLRKSGDSTSRIMPVEYLQDNMYRIHFENSFEFVTDTLINTVYEVLKKENLEKGYIVRAVAIPSQETIYTYEVSSATDYQIPCLGVLNPSDKYFVEITFLPQKSQKSIAWIIIGLAMIGGVGLFIYSKNAQQSSSSNLGEYYFRTEDKKLQYKKENIELTHQEKKLLELLFQGMNNLVTRDLLLEEIWEKEGVVVTSRSLDVLVSKLRKKLSKDENIKISNIHGKGYKLEVS